MLASLRSSLSRRLALAAILAVAAIGPLTGCIDEWLEEDEDEIGHTGTGPGTPECQDYYDSFPAGATQSQSFCLAAYGAACAGDEQARVANCDILGGFQEYTSFDVYAACPYCP